MAPDGTDGAIGLLSHRALPQLCVQLDGRCPLSARRRALSGLAAVLRSRSLDAGTALELLRRCGAVGHLLEILREDIKDSPASTPASIATAARGSSGGGRVGPPPSQSDAALRDGALHALGLIAHLGGIELLQPPNKLTAVLAGALFADDVCTRAHAAVFWRAATVWESYANDLARAIFPLGAVRSSGVRIEGHGAFTNGVGVLLALSAGGTGEGGVASRAGVECALAAAGALANTLQHAALRPLWTSAPEKLAYLLMLDDEQVKRILALPDKLTRP